MQNIPIKRRTVLASGAGILATSVVMSGCSEDDPLAEIESGDVIANIADIPASGVLSTKLSSGLDVLISNVSGEIVVMSAICPHQGCTVVDDEDSLVCPCHRSAFTRDDGELTRGPADENLTHIAVEIAQDGSISVV